ncbi:MAG: ROK family protein [Burkholderiales bacterium]|nr:ROK family protein [Burkholderiales bacterium]
MARLQSRQISQLHLYQVRHAVRVAGTPLSRAQIAEATGLSQPAVSSLTRRLLRSGALVEVGARPSSGSGRRERELALNAEHAWVVGVRVALHQVTIALSDFAGGVRDTLVVPMPKPPTAAELVRLLERRIERFLAAAGGAVRARLAGVGIALPGFIDSMRGEVLWSPALERGRSHAPAPMAEALTRRLGVPVLIENDANMLALAEQWFGRSAHVADMAVVTIEHGLGLGLIVNGELHRGHRGIATELAHLQVAPDGPMCRCGKRGCLETYVSHAAVVRQARHYGIVPGSDDLPPAEVMQAYSELAALARGGDTRALGVLVRQGQLLGQWIGNVVNLLAPELVLFDGGATIASDLYEPALRDSMEQALLLPQRGLIELVVRHQGDEAWARGASSLVLQRLDESSDFLESISRHGFENDNVARRPAPPDPPAATAEQRAKRFLTQMETS